MAIRAKFKIDSISRHAGWNGNKEHHMVKLSPVTSGSEENKAFYAASPGGSMDLTVVKPEVFAGFSPGDEFYIDITPAKPSA